MNLPSSDQVLAVSRHVATFIAGMAVLAGALGLKPEDVTAVADSIGQLGTGLAAIVTAIGIIVPIVSGLFAGKSASPAAQVRKVESLPDVTVRPLNDDGAALIERATGRQAAP